jgi:membrane-bound serine protease (ClpP class)
MPSVRTSVLLSVVIVTGLLAGVIGPALAGPITRVHVIEVQGPIDRPLLAYVEERLAEAERAGAIVVLQLDTPGTLGQDGVALAERIARLRVPVIAWVGPAPAKAAGAGLLLMLASSLAAVAPGSQTGPVLPVDVLHPDAGIDGLETRIEALLEEGHREVDVRAASHPLPAQGALDAGIAGVVAYTVPELLTKVDGMTVPTPGGAVVLRTRVATTRAEARERTVDIRFEEPGLIGRVLHAVGTPSMVYFLLVLGLAALAFEITQAGFGFAGFSGIGLLALAAYGLTVAVPDWLGLALFVGGVGLLTMDVWRRGLSWPTWVGLAAFAVGSVLAWRGVDPAIRVSPWLIGGAIAASVLYYGFGLTVALQSRDRIVGTQRGLVGLAGETRGRLAPDGPVFVKGALWRGRSLAGPIEPGTRVRVRSVDGLILRVEAESGTSPGLPGT